MTNRLKAVGGLLALALLAGGCAAGQTFRQGDAATRAGDLDQAVAAYRRAVQADADNPRYKIALERAMQAALLDKALRDRVEAARPRPAGQGLGEPVAVPVLGPTLRFPLRVNNTGLRDTLNFIANLTGINVNYDRDVMDRAITLQLDDVNFEQALNQIMTMNRLSYKVLNEKSIFVFPDDRK